MLLVCSDAGFILIRPQPGLALALNAMEPGAPETNYEAQPQPGTRDWAPHCRQAVRRPDLRQRHVATPERPVNTVRAGWPRPPQSRLRKEWKLLAPSRVAQLSPQHWEQEVQSSKHQRAGSTPSQFWNSNRTPLRTSFP